MYMEDILRHKDFTRSQLGDVSAFLCNAQLLIRSIVARHRNRCGHPETRLPEAPGLEP
jgi:hypothetical protein